MMALESQTMAEHAAVAYGSSESQDAAVAATELFDGLSGVEPACVIFFCCVDYNREELGRALATLFGDIPVLGCTTAGEISPFGMRSGSIAGFALSRDHFVVETTLLPNLASFSERGAFDTIKQSLERLEDKALAPVGENSFALSLLDGLSVQEELVLSALNDALPGIPLVGGSAGDNLHFRDTHIYYDKQFFSNAAAIILVNTRRPFTVIHGHHLTPGEEKLVVTKADAAKRIVYEFNAEPAALEYCRIMGISLDELSTRNFAMHPLSVQVGDNTFVRSVQQVNDDLSLTFFCAIDTGIVLTKMKNGRLIEEFDQRMRRVVAEVGDPDIVIGYDCIHRRIEVEDTDSSEALEALYRRYKIVGFNTYGEHCDAMHVNHTFTGVAIGKYDDFPL
ncbi:FIST C-terminal domain-containing protein [Spongiibacter nanhainus]|uniref:FIST C-terminal domain-containing protein n=1 Tax=Spongiibacter nanhainus TaxID=2794344 RepID=A0A7T4UPN8_9GAMM|nr:nitric oxide-sensing protein NosP [Spongiibacter nanhainus]QQD17883.1 FIST C-terminal domain-containing protein [Spongiibacter nanhainus]